MTQTTEGFAILIKEHDGTEQFWMEKWNVPFLAETTEFANEERLNSARGYEARIVAATLTIESK